MSSKAYLEAVAHEWNGHGPALANMGVFNVNDDLQLANDGPNTSISGYSRFKIKTFVKLFYTSQHLCLCGVL